MLDPPSHDPARKPTSPHCWMIAAPPVIIDDTYMSIQQGFERVNYNFHVNGTQSPTPTVKSLQGPKV
jgi:hypothetical protein